MMHPSLQKSYRGIYPFRLATTSFIYPAGYEPNVRMLSPHVDEVELLFFDSLYDGSLPSDEEIGQLAEIAVAEGITYNIHLPVDVSISDPSPRKRGAAVDMMKHVFKKTGILDPTTWTLHVPYGGDPDDVLYRKKWKGHAFAGISEILSTGLDSRKISVETLHYPFEWMDTIIEGLDLSVCMDMGHLITDGVNPVPFYEKYGDRISIFHIHGVRDDRDHLSLDMLEDNWKVCLEELLSSFKGTVSIEVFSYENLVSSLKCLGTLMHTFG